MTTASAADRTFLTFDFGATSLRSGLVDQHGHLVASHTQPTATLDPARWWADLQISAAAVLEDSRDRAVAAIAISAMTRTQVLVDPQGVALTEAIGFADTRAASLLPELLARLPAEDAETTSVNAYHPLTRLFWLARHEPELLARAAHVLDPKDHLNAQLTGRISSDPISCARLAASRPRLFAAAGLDQRLLPPLVSPLSIVGLVQSGLAGPFSRLAGVPVITMAHDTWASVLGLGAMRPDVAYNLSGTTEVLGLFANRPATAHGLLTVEWVASSDAASGLYQIGGPSLAGGDTVRWLRDVIGYDGDLAALVAQAPDDAPPLLFLPYLAGERVPHWDPDLRGAWIGLDRRHGPPHLARAVLDGIAHLNRRVLTRAEAAAGTTAIEVRFGGGGAVNTAWRQIKADVLNRPILVTDSEHHGLIGAAVAARVALGGTLAAAQAEMVRVARRFDPRPQERARSEVLHQLYIEADASVAPLSRALAQMRP